jgi:hypothetical protein
MHVSLAEGGACFCTVSNSFTPETKKNGPEIFISGPHLGSTPELNISGNQNQRPFLVKQPSPKA